MKEINQFFLPLTEEMLHLNNNKEQIINVLMKADKDNKTTVVDILEDKE